MTVQRIIIDSDPGIDDALAILMALAAPEVKLEGVTIVHGNCSLKQGTENALSVLELAQATHIPVAAGHELPLVQPSLLAPDTHGNTGMGYAQFPPLVTKPIQQHAVDFIIDKIMQSPGEITLVPVGPLTNIAAAVRREPRIVDAVKDVIIMGGAIRVGGNTTPLAEFNTYVDPHATHIVFHSGMPITLVPLDVTYQCILMRDDVEQLLKIDSAIARLVADSTRFYMEFHDEYQQMDGCAINDPLALALVFAPELVDTEEHYVDVDIAGGVSMGKTFADFYRMGTSPPNMKVALGVRSRDFLELFLEHIKKLCLDIEV